MFDFFVGFVLGALIGREGLRGCCGCIVLCIGLMIGLAALAMLLFGSDVQWQDRLSNGLIGVVVGALIIWGGWLILRPRNR